jgi:hypothetical protein
MRLGNDDETSDEGNDSSDEVRDDVVGTGSHGRSSGSRGGRSSRGPDGSDGGGAGTIEEEGSERVRGGEVRGDVRRGGGSGVRGSVDEDLVNDVNDTVATRRKGVGEGISKGLEFGTHLTRTSERMILATTEAERT